MANHRAFNLKLLCCCCCRVSCWCFLVVVFTIVVAVLSSLLLLFSCYKKWLKNSLFAARILILILNLNFIKLYLYISKSIFVHMLRTRIKKIHYYSLLFMQNHKICKSKAKLIYHGKCKTTTCTISPWNISSLSIKLHLVPPCPFPCQDLPSDNQSK